MSDHTERLSLPFILPNQAQKHVTHNESLQLIDALLHLSIRAFASAPPVSAANGEVYGVAEAATGLFAGHEGDLAIRIDGSWTFVTPRIGFSAFNQATDKQATFTATGWSEVTAQFPDTPRFSQLGVNATADAADKLAVASDTTLFTHQGNGHRLKLNKATAAETVSLLMQDNYSGRAEIGLAGSDDLSMKVSADGTTWRTAMTIGGADGIVRMPLAPKVRASNGGSSGTSIASSASYMIGFNALALNQGNWTLGSAVPSPGSGKYLVVPADGVYLITANLYITLLNTSITLNLYANGTVIQTWRQGLSTGGTLSALVSLTAGMALAVQLVAGPASLIIDLAAGRTDVSLHLA